VDERGQPIQYVDERGQPAQPPVTYVQGGASITEPAGGQQLVYVQDAAGGQQLVYLQQPAAQPPVTYAAAPTVQYVDERGQPVQYVDERGQPVQLQQPAQQFAGQQVYYVQQPAQQPVTYAAAPTVQYVDERGQPIQYLEAPQVPQYALAPQMLTAPSMLAPSMVTPMPYAESMVAMMPAAAQGPADNNIVPGTALATAGAKKTTKKVEKSKVTKKKRACC